MTGPLEGVRVVELAADHVSFAGKLLADYGADVIVVEPPGGHPSRRYGPFVDDEPGPERGLWWFHYNTSKRGVVLDLDDPEHQECVRDLVATSDVVLEGEAPGSLRRLGLDYPDLRPLRPEIIWTSITAFGRAGPRHDHAFTDLTVLAGGGPVWSCGYDDHSLPPVRGGGNQGYQTAGIHAVMATLAAWFHRARTGRGQFIDVNMHAAANVTTEGATVRYLVGGLTVQRMTGRHAMPQPTAPSMATAADGRLVHTGVPPRTSAEVAKLLTWLDELGLRDECPATVLLELGAERVGPIGENDPDAEVRAIFGAGRDALVFIAGRLTSYEFFVDAERHGLSCGIVYAPEEVLDDPHLVARGFATDVAHPELGRAFRYLGRPFAARPWGPMTRAPLVGEHDDEVLGPLRAARRR